MLPVSAHPNTWWERWGGSVLLAALLILALIAAVVLALNTPWVLDEPMPQYDWTTIR
ncbi:MAG TPA: hypothetical protein VFO07_09215 [Roseiflexaceae bacterium]|nr:hypothetical protein [Roseiflexaceae bacterium]